jgi:hypothetical protein
MTPLEPLGPFLSVHHEAAKELNDETFYLAPGHQHNPSIIRNWAITDRATARAEVPKSKESWL